MPDVLLLVALKTDQRDIRHRIEVVLAVAAPTHEPPDTIPHVWARSLDELEQADLDGLARYFGREGVAGLNAGEASADAAQGLGLELAAVTRQRDTLAGGIRSFLSSLPFAAPESLGWHANVKLAGAMARAGLEVQPERRGPAASGDDRG